MPSVFARARAAASSTSSEEILTKPSRRRVREGLAGAVGGQRLGVEHVRRAAAGDDGGVRPQLDAHLALDELLRLVDERVDRLARRAEPEALVDELRPALLEAALDPRLVLRQDDVLERRVRRDQHDRGRRLVHLAALDPDGAVLDHVDPPDPVRAGERVQPRDELGERQLLAVERDGHALPRSRS